MHVQVADELLLARAVCAHQGDRRLAAVEVDVVDDRGSIARPRRQIHGLWPRVIVARAAIDAPLRVPDEAPPRAAVGVCYPQLGAAAERDPLPVRRPTERRRGESQLGATPLGRDDDDTALAHEAERA